MICFPLLIKPLTLTPTALLLKDLLLETPEDLSWLLGRVHQGLHGWKKHREIQSKVFQKEGCILTYSLKQIALKRFILSLVFPLELLPEVD